MIRNDVITAERLIAAGWARQSSGEFDRSGDRLTRTAPYTWTLQSKGMTIAGIRHFGKLEQMQVAAVTESDKLAKRNPSVLPPPMARSQGTRKGRSHGCC